MARSPFGRKREEEQQGNPGAEDADAAAGGEAVNEAQEGATDAAPSGDNGEAKKPKKTLDEKQADFRRLLSNRMSTVVDGLNKIGNLANTQSYDWTDEQLAKLIKTLREKTDHLEASFTAAKAPAEGRKKAARQLSYLA